jgi:glyoxylase-like metal-dependent hydrolase (beta-lactamase superfamily II)
LDEQEESDPLLDSRLLSSAISVVHARPPADRPVRSGRSAWPFDLCRFLDVGQGDATPVQHGRHALLVDTGPPGPPILRRLRDAGVRRLDALVITHSSADHDGGAAAVRCRAPAALERPPHRSVGIARRSHT